MQFTIPLKPLAISKAWQGRRFATKEYRDWAADVAHFVPKTTLFGPVEVTVELFIKNDKMSDCDNFMKTLLDTLTKCGVYEDDRMIYALHVHKYHDTDEHIRVTVTPYD